MQVIPNLVPPYNVTLSSYTITTSDKINVKLLLTDINESNRQVRLKLIIKGQGLNIQSQQFVSGAASLFISGGELKTLTNFDLRPYFESNNLVGIAPQVYNRPLPDGLYQFCFEVYDYFTNQLISNPNQGCALANNIINDPPFLNLPQRGELVTLKDPVNIIFQWTPRHLNATNVSYEFELREIWDNNIDPQAGFLVSPPLYQTTTFATTLLYDISKPSLLPNKTYGWRVRAISSTGISENSVFRNNGYSEIYNFKLTNSCDAPIYPLSEAISHSTVKITWQDNPAHNKYHIQYKKASVPDAEWFEVFIYNNQAQISNLEAGVTYDFRVGGTCTSLTEFTQAYTYTNVNQFTMPTEDEDVSYNCGVTPDIQITNQNPLQNIGVNETFTAGDFPVTVKEIQGINGRFTGNGFIVVPYLAGTKIAVAFEGITINTDYQLIDGVVKTTYDPNWGDVESVNNSDLFDNLIDSIKDVFEDNNIDVNIDDSQLPVEFILLSDDISDVKIDDKNIIIELSKGTTIKLPKDEDVKFTDKNGNQFDIDKDDNLDEIVTSSNKKDRKVKFKIKNDDYEDGDSFISMNNLGDIEIELIAINGEDLKGNIKWEIKNEKTTEGEELKKYIFSSNKKAERYMLKVTKDNEIIGKLNIDLYDKPILKFEMPSGSDFDNTYLLVSKIVKTMHFSASRFSF